MTRDSYSGTNKSKMGYGKKLEPTRQFGLRLRHETIAGLRELAAEQNMPMSRYTRKHLAEWVIYQKRLKLRELKKQNVD